MRGILKFFSILGTVAGMSLVPLAATAAPQALGLVATKGSVPLICRDGDCSAEFSSFCLQEERRTPLSGTLYRLVGNGEIRLIGETKDGRKITLDPYQYLKMTTVRAYLSVRLSMLETDLSRLGLRGVEVEVGKNVAMAPLPEAGDPNPISETELKLATGPLRDLGTFVIDRDPERMDAARITNRIVNRLHDGARPDAAERERLWKKAIAASNEIAPEALGRARTMFRYCDNLMASGKYTKLRHCLAEHHDRLLEYLTEEYWDSIDAGS